MVALLPFGWLGLRLASPIKFAVVCATFHKALFVSGRAFSASSTASLFELGSDLQLQPHHDISVLFLADHSTHEAPQRVSLGVRLSSADWWHLIDCPTCLDSSRDLRSAWKLRLVRECPLCGMISRSLLTECWSMAISLYVADATSSEQSDYAALPRSKNIPSRCITQAFTGFSMCS